MIMISRHVLTFAGVMSALMAPFARADEPADSAVSHDQVKAAVGKSLALLQTSRASYIEQRDCFACHHQGVPTLAIRAAQSRGLAIDEENLQIQLDFTSEFLGRNREGYRKGKGQGGAVDTAGYALWTLEIGGWAPDETTAAVVEYLLQQGKTNWRTSSKRPPSELSDFTATYLALRSLKTFAASDQKARADERVKAARGWLLATPAKDTEDRVFRLWGLKYADAEPKDIQAAAEELRKTQRDDGGWAQTDSMESDAYATGSALAVLGQAGGLATSDPSYQRGLRWLLKHQRDDGSWHVVSRSRPFQTYFESGFPHGKDQFISIAASGWATAALAWALPSQDAAGE